MSTNTEDEAKWERRMLCELIAVHQATIQTLGEKEWQGESKYRYYRAGWYLQQAVLMLKSIGESQQSKVIEVSK